MTERELRVGAHAGHRSPDRPRWVEIEGDRLDVGAVEREWRE